MSYVRVHSSTFLLVSVSSLCVRSLNIARAKVRTKWFPATESCETSNKKQYLTLSLAHTHTLSLPQLDLARKLEKIAAEKGVQLFLATDVIVADKFAPDANNKVRTSFLIFQLPYLLTHHTDLCILIF